MCSCVLLSRQFGLNGSRTLVRKEQPLVKWHIVLSRRMPAYRDHECACKAFTSLLDTTIASVTRPEHTLLR